MFYLCFCHACLRFKLVHISKNMQKCPLGSHILVGRRIRCNTGSASGSVNAWTMPRKRRAYDGIFYDGADKRESVRRSGTHRSTVSHSSLRSLPKPRSQLGDCALSGMFVTV